MPPTKGIPKYIPEFPAQQIRKLSCGNSICSIQNLSPCPPVFKKLLKGLRGNSRPPNHESCRPPLPFGPAFPETCNETSRHLTVLGEGDWCGHTSLGHLPGHRGFLHAPKAFFFRLLLRGTQIAFETVFHCVLKASPSMSINISSYSWNKSFLCSVLLPTGVQMACFMWWPLFTIQLHGGP